ncbi:hypothetical protein [Cohnella sp. REN36]|uniref:hypothetical protein n=1 Tax=Cohnella sp. REN36 TaxID=2887347 RepID=UPI001D14A1EE|nr:hypothetical protein [Cohnella sp. REN36]MCC3374013.1 hypothetical protein [Cohnella sp. REN36]
MRFTIEERDHLLQNLNHHQRAFLTDTMIRGRRTAFANAMAKQKGFHLPDDASFEEIEALLEDWIYVSTYDAGYVSHDLRCECGRPLRYQHRVEHKTTGEVKKFGIEHLKEHLGIDAAVVAAVKKGFDAIDYELDEILAKAASNWRLDPEFLQVDEIPSDIQTHLDHGLPLLERQIARLRDRRRKRVKPDLQQANVAPAYQNQAPRDLFEWQEMQQISTSDQAPQIPISDLFRLPDRLHKHVQHYLNRGIKSARIICELLIKEHGAPNARYITGKPHLFVPLCKHIENHHSDYNMKPLGADDRSYQK